MRFLERAPAWVVGLAGGPVLALLWGLWMVRVDGLAWQQAAVLALVAAPAFGVVLGLVAHRLRRRLDDAVGSWPVGRERATRRASWRGPAPLDPEVRDGALRLAMSMRDGLDRQWWAAPVLVAAVLGAVVLARTGSAWWYAGAAELAVLLLLHLLTPRHLDRRIAELETVSSSRPGRRTPA